MDRAQRRAIDKALENYSSVASTEFANGVTSRAYWSLREVFHRVAGPESFFALPEDFQREIESRTSKPCANLGCEVPPALQAALKRAGGPAPAASPPLERMTASECAADCGVRNVIRYYFHYDVASRETTLRGGAAASPPDYAKKLAKMLEAELDTMPTYGAFVTHSVLDLDGEPQILVYITRRGSGADLSDVYGFAAAADGYTRALVEPLYRERPLLPIAIVGRAPGDSLYSLTISDSAGRAYYRSPVQYAGRFRGRVPIDPSLNPLTVELALRPETAERLVMGGIPKSRLPMIAALFALTTVLLLFVIRQLRSEYHWARARDYFVSGVSHELRTPLAQIVLYSDLLRFEKLPAPEERQRATEVIAEEARRLTILVENLLRFSREGGGQPRIYPFPTALGPLVHATVQAFAPLVSSTGATLKTSVDDRVWASVDQQAIRQIVFNLLDNAVKYGRKAGTVRISTALDGAEARIEVEDQGPGIPPEDRERAWEPFIRLAHRVDEPVAGSGIGLAVVRTLVELHGGRAWIEGSGSGSLGGARVVVALPGGWHEDEGSGDPGGASSATEPSARPIM